MTGVLLAFVIVTLVPLFVATWRTSLLGLALQSSLIAWLALRHQTSLSFASVHAVVDLIVIRTLLAPGLLHRAMTGRNAPGRNDVIAPNLLSWASAIALVVVAFRTADALVPVDGDEQMLVAVSASGFVLGLFVLATARGPFSQVVGVLRIENAIALFELGAGPHEGIDAIRVGMTAVFVVSVVFYAWYVQHLAAEGQPPPVTESPAL